MLVQLVSFSALVSVSLACCGLSIPTCGGCGATHYAYAPGRIIGYERIPLYAKVSPPTPAYFIEDVPQYVRVRHGVQMIVQAPMAPPLPPMGYAQQPQAPLQPPKPPQLGYAQQGPQGPQEPIPIQRSYSGESAPLNYNGANSISESAQFAGSQFPMAKALRKFHRKTLKQVKLQR